MKFRFAIGSSVAALAVLGAAIASQKPAGADIGGSLVFTPEKDTEKDSGKPMGDAIIQIAAVTQQVAQFASTAAILGPTVTPQTLADATTRPISPLKAVSVHAAANKIVAGSRERADTEAAHFQQLAALKPMLVRCVGRIETGRAAWYGGHYIGQQTSSGDRLDTIRPTAAHRTLPLNSLARVTNLQNGRSVIVKVTDRGPVSPTLLIDMSPRAADELAMKNAGVVPVKIEPVVEVASAAK